MIINGAEMYADISDYMQGRLVNFIVEGGALEFFIFSSVLGGPKS
jgi:hypothetical protein